MIANWVKKRAKYLLRGIRDLLDDLPQAQAQVALADSRAWERTQHTAQTVYLNGMAERHQYNDMLRAPLPAMPLAEPA
jgi:hypothetical protein